MFNCDSYTGVTCVDGGCPDALAEEYSDYGYCKGLLIFNSSFFMKVYF